MHDLRLALRALRATPVVTSVAVLSLALGIGANTAIFSLVNELLLRPLPVKDPHRLVLVSTGPELTEQYGYKLFEQIRRHGESFDGALAWSLGGKSVLKAGAQTETVEHHFVTSFAQRKDPILFSNFFITLRASAGSPLPLIRSVSSALTAINPELRLTLRPLAAQVDESLAQDRLIAILSGFFGALALLLAAVGLYGVTSYAVARRWTEIGIRAALGAAPIDIIRLVLARVARLVSVGVVLGAVLGLSASTFVASLVYGIAPRDVRVVTMAAATLAAVAALAGWLPAWRASRIEPASVLRDS
jgi:predicted lysophospholipase L1 biosynthesis ABC-type transport system permease subunit